MRRIRTLAGFLALSAIGGAAPRTFALPPGDPAVARTLYREAVRFGASDKVKLAMFEAAVVESLMRNLPYGDRDSRGVFQIRTSLWGWATATNVALSADWFLRRAIPIQNRYGSAGALAQAVEGSALPWRYNQEYWNALAWLNYAKGATAPAPAPAPGGSAALKVNPSTLNVRSGPGTGYALIGTVRSGQIYIASGSGGGWWKIWYDQRTGWVNGGFVSKVAGVSAVVVNVSLLNVRTGPSTGSAIAGKVTRGEQFCRIPNAGVNGFYKIYWRGGGYYVSGSFVTRKSY